MVDDLTKARAKRKFEASNSTKHLEPRDALLAALDAIDRGEINPHHCVVVIGQTYDGRGKISCKYYSAGPLDYWGHIGLMTHALDEIKGP